mgnify:CR=1 FL=1
MDSLLDTHSFIWWLEKPDFLSSLASAAISDTNNNVFISSITFLELGIKQSIGKLVTAKPFEEAFALYGFYELPLTAKQAYAVKNLPLHHKDPFDRALIAQAKITGLTLVTRDKIFAKYEIPIIEA